MTRHGRRFAVCMACLAAVSAARGGDLKVAVVDMETVLEASDEMAAAKAAIKAKLDELEARRDRMRDEMATLKEEVEAAQQAAQNKALSEDARETKMELAREKYIRLSGMQREMRAELAEGRKEISNREVEFITEIVSQLRKEVAAYAGEKGFTLVLDTSGMAVNGVPSVLYHTAAMDVTSDILKRIGARAPDGEETR